MKASMAVARLRQELSLSQEGLATKLGVSFTSVNRWERGRSTPRNSMAKKIDALLMHVAQQSEQTEPAVRRPGAYSLFAGAGGFDLGVERAGFKIVLATDIDEMAERTHRRNWPRVPFLRADIRQVSAEALLSLADGKRPDLVFGGPPCQGFSTLGDKLSSDPRNDLFEAYARLVEKLEPKCVLLENVKAFATMYRGRFLNWIIQRLASMGYLVFHRVVNAADYGVPQVRQRLIVFGTRLGNPFAFPEPTHGPTAGLRPFVTVKDCIMDLAHKGAEVPNHIVLSHSEKVLRRYRLIPEGGRLPPLEKLPPDIRRRNFGNTYKRLHRERPSLTMVPGNNAFPIHPTLDRSLTPREAARIQTFPDSFSFEGDRRSQCILVGNAVPPLLGEVVAKAVLEHMRGRIPSAVAEEPELFVVSRHSGASPLEAYLGIANAAQSPADSGFVDLFCGAGGFAIGFCKAGWRPMLCADWNRAVAETHRKNYPSIPFLEGDLAEHFIQDTAVTALGGGEVGVIVGGPPCQGFSIFGKRRFVNSGGYNPQEDARNKLVYAFLGIVGRIRPRWFVMENVPGLASLDGGAFLGSLLKAFRSIGYGSAEARVLNAADYGVPQIRKRLIIIGNRTGHIIPWPKKKYFEHPQDWQDSYRTAGEVIFDLAQPDSYTRFSCHAPMKHKPLLVERYKYIPEGGSLNVESLPPHLRKGYRTEQVKNYSHVFKRLHRDRPAWTMVPGHNAFPIHPWLHRSLTVREAARIQTFPDEIVFMGSRQEQCIQVGNAFPPLLAELIANNIKKAEANSWYPRRVPASAYYSLVDMQQGFLFDVGTPSVTKGAMSK